MAPDEPTTGHVVALDVGGTVLKGAVVAPGGCVVRELRRPTDRDRGSAAVVDTVLDVLDELVALTRSTTGAPPLGAGLVVPGRVDDRRGVAQFSANIGWTDVPLVELAEQRLGLPVGFGHDVRAGGLAELVLGAARGVADCLFLAVGTGIAAAVVVDGRPYAGAHGLAGEIGHLRVRPDGATCGCGARGCLESVASASALASAYAREGTPDDPGSAAEVIGRAAAGEPLATRLVTGVVDALADAVTAYVTLLDPEVVVLGGGLARADESLLLHPLRDAVAARLTFQTPPRFRTGELGDTAGCLGAALLALQRVGVPLSAAADARDPAAGPHDADGAQVAVEDDEVGPATGLEGPDVS